jgi:hypothetical protein
MSSPHIAGMAALFKESNSSWTPAQIKSALMTTARQDLTKEDGATPADPYDFGSGHAEPVSALDPGLLLDTNLADHLAFLCGQGEDAFVESYNTTCATLTANGFSTDASQLNLPSIAIAELVADETIYRTVSNATSASSSYTATIEAPAGIEVNVQTFDANGDETQGSTLDIDAGGQASFALTFSKTESTELKFPMIFNLTSVESSRSCWRKIGSNCSIVKSLPAKGDKSMTAFAIAALTFT